MTNSDTNQYSVLVHQTLENNHRTTVKTSCHSPLCPDFIKSLMIPIAILYSIPILNIKSFSPVSNFCFHII